MGQSGEDIQLSPAARKVIPISIECKARASIAVYKFFEQAQQNTKEGTEPVVFIRQNRSKPLVVVDAEYFLDLMKGKSNE
jgi:hypothetical protein